MKIRNELVAALCFSFGVYLPACLALNAKWNIFLDVGMISTSSFLLMLISIRQKFFTTLSVLQSTSLSCAVIFAFLSAVQHNSLMSFLPVLGLVSLFFIFSTMSAIVTDPERLGSLIVKFCMIIGIAMVILALSTEPFHWERYRGYTHNQNSLSWLFTATAGLSGGALFMAQKKNSLKSVLLFGYFVMSLLLIVSTTTRAAFVGIAFAYGIFLVIFVTSNRPTFPMIASIASVSGVLMIISYNGYLDPFVNKWLSTIEHGDMSQGRVEAWMVSLDAVNFLGHGPTYSYALDFGTSSAGHNLFIHLLSAYGIVVAVSVLFFFVIVWVDLIRVLRKNEIPLSIPAFIIFTSYLVQANASTTLVAPGLWLSLALYSVVKQREKSVDHEKKRQMLAGRTEFA